MKYLLVVAHPDDEVHKDRQYLYGNYNLGDKGNKTKKDCCGNRSGERAEFPAIRPTWRRAGQLLQELLPAVQGFHDFR